MFSSEQAIGIFSQTVLKTEYKNMCIFEPPVSSLGGNYVRVSVSNGPTVANRMEHGASVKLCIFADTDVIGKV